MCDCISEEDLRYIVGKAIEWFDANEEKSIDWSLARKAVNGEKNRGDEREKVKEYIRSRINNNRNSNNNNRNSNIETFINYMYGNIQNYDEEKDILLFLISWNIQRFNGILENYGGKNEDKNEKKQYIEKWLEAIRNIKKYIEYIEREGKNKSYEEIFRFVLCQYQWVTNAQERVITAKTLLVMNPDKFVAWDNQIISIFFGKLSQQCFRIEKMYGLFNQAIDKFLSECDLEKHLEELNTRYGYKYGRKKLLDMILYIYANGKLIDDSRFIFNVCKIVCAIITHLSNLNNCV